jgi:hypothetical protein
LLLTSATLRLQIAAHAATRDRKAWRPVLAQQADEITLNYDPGASRVHGPGVAFKDLYVRADTAQCDTGA